MADATYGPKTYRDRSGDRFNVVSGGSVNIESGSTTLIAGNFKLSQANSDITATASAVPAHGLTVIATTAGVQPTMHLAAPVAGANAHIIFGAAGSTSITVSTTGASATIGSTFTSAVVTGAAYAALSLRGRSATRWDVTGSHGTVTIS